MRLYGIQTQRILFFYTTKIFRGQNHRKIPLNTGGFYFVIVCAGPVDALSTPDLLLSLYGLQEVVGGRGTLFPAYSLCETANFQSNIDHLPIHVDLMLRQAL